MRKFWIIHCLLPNFSGQKLNLFLKHRKEFFKWEEEIENLDAEKLIRAHTVKHALTRLKKLSAKKQRKIKQRPNKKLLSKGVCSVSKYIVLI